MPLPQQVIDRLSREPAKTPGWSLGIVTFSGGTLFLAVVVYLGLAFGYGPYLDAQITQLNAQLDTLAKTISPDDQARLVTFYSEIANLKTVLNNHVAFSRFLAWLEKNTEANVYYSRASFSTENQVLLSGFAKNEADVNQQLVIFERDPSVTNANLSTITLSESDHLWQFSITLTLTPSLFLASSPQ
jgi:Tfp pilus assembly protein PilN